MNFLSYDDVLVRIAGETPSLLLGNGFSRALHAGFAYNSLFEVAKSRGLSPTAIAIFEEFGTTNFEAVMRLLEDSNWIALHYKLLPYGVPNPMTGDLTNIRHALISAIKETHPAHTFSLDVQQKQSCRHFLSTFGDIFSLNYDLLLYWALNDDNSFKIDGFGFPAIDYQNPPYLVLTQPRITPNWLFNLHGALHLFTVDGETRKRRYNYHGRPLIDVIGEGIENSEYPLFVAEGSAKQKLRHIRSNSYLSFCFQEFKKSPGTLVCYGLSFGESDGHIIDAIIENPRLHTLFVGIYGDPDSPDNLKIKLAIRQLEQKRRQLEVKRRERGKNVQSLAIEYFDSESANVWTRPL